MICTPSLFYILYDYKIKYCTVKNIKLLTELYSEEYLKYFLKNH